MKDLYTRRRSKGKLRPTIASSSSPSLLLSRLPTEIRTLVSAQLPPEDLEILSYLIKTDHQPTTCNSCTAKSHPHFDCSCFHCYAFFWTRWDSSPNRNIIHQALDAFERQQQMPKKRNRRVSANTSMKTVRKSLSIQQQCTPDDALEEEEEKKYEISDVGGVISPQARNQEEEEEEKKYEISDVGGVSFPQPSNQEEEEEEDELDQVVWPDVLGFLNSRLWSHWSRNV